MNRFSFDIWFENKSIEQKNAKRNNGNFSDDSKRLNFSINLKSDRSSQLEVKDNKCSLSISNEIPIKIKAFFSGHNLQDLLSQILFPDLQEKATEKVIQQSDLRSFFFMLSKNFYNRGSEDIKEAEKMFSEAVASLPIEYSSDGHFLGALGSNFISKYEFASIMAREISGSLMEKKPKKEELNRRYLEFDSPFLNKIKIEYPFFDEYKVSFTKEEKTETGIEFINGKITFYKVGVEMDILEALTWGQKRFVYLLSKIKEQKTPLIDEIENGFHPKMVEDLINSIYEQKKQAFITTHSHNIINSLNYESMEELGKSIVICKMNKNDKLNFSNLKGKNLELNFKKVKTGMVDLPESLRFEGVW